MSSSPRAAAGPAAAALVAVVVLAVAWNGLYREVGANHVAALCILALLPAAASLAPRGRVAAVAAALLVAVPTTLALALRRPVGDLLLLRGDAWTDVQRLVPRGMRAGADTGLPVSPGDRPELVALLDVALVVLAGVAAWQILARRRPVAGLVAVGVGLAYRWTVEPPASSAAAGALALGGLVVVLALASWDARSSGPAWRLGGTVAIGGAVVVLAAALGAGPAQAGSAWWSWKDWELAGSDPGAATLDTGQGYGALDRSGEPREVLRVRTEVRLPIRAAALDDFDGVSFVPTEGDLGPMRLDGKVIDFGVTAIPAGSERFEQRITVRATRSQRLLYSGRPWRATGPFGSSAEQIDGAVQIERELRTGDQYTVHGYVPRPDPGDLIAAGAYDPATMPEGETRVRAPRSGRAFDVPAFGSGREGPSDAELGVPYARVRELARRIAGDAAGPYAAVNRIEEALRAGYVYDEDPPVPEGLPQDPTRWPPDRPPLAVFLLETRTGYCQHFAGSMALMLRTLGIPARVVVGYTGGAYVQRIQEWSVTDRDAHSWVEVWFPEWGWIPFDPTPGRSAPNPASVSSADYAPTLADIDERIAERPVNPGDATGEEAPPRTPQTTDAPEPAPAPAAAPAAGGSPWRWAFLALLVPFAVAPGARLARRLRGRLGGDERDRVVAAARDLEDSLSALGWAPAANATPRERAGEILARTGIDPTPLYERAARARFSPQPVAAGAAAEAWRDVARLRRRIRRRAPLGRRVLATLGLRWRRRDTVGA
ncbi:MAG: transglutaminaseTgpA domain-containing protein [Thermoleophilia bacterium]